MFPGVSFHNGISSCIQVRRLAFYDTRNASHYTVVFNCLYNDQKERPNSNEEIDKGIYNKENLTKLYTLLTFENEITVCFPLEYWSANKDHHRKTRILRRENFANYILRTTGFISKAPLYGQLSTKSNCTELSEPIYIKDDTTEATYNYGVCLHKSLYDLNEPEMLIRWVELNMALGAEFITIFLQNGDIPESYYTLMIPYIKKGIVEVLDWGLRPPVIPGYTKDWGQTAVVTECVYRNMYRVKYLGLYDIDEYIVPQKVKTIPELIDSIEFRSKRARRASSYSFENVYYYDRERSLPELSQSSLLTECPGMKLPRYYTFTLRYYKKLPKFFNKLIVKPKVVISVWNHWVKKWIDGYHQEYAVSPKQAALHHYRLPERFRPKNPSFSFIISQYFNDTVKGIKEHTCGAAKISQL